MDLAPENKVGCGYCKWERPRVCTIHDRTNKAKDCSHFVNVFKNIITEQPKNFKL